MKLRTKFMAAVLAILFGAIGLSTLWIYYSSSKNAAQQAIESSIGLSDMVHGTVLVLMRAGHQDELDAYLKNAQKSESVAELRVIRSAALEKERGVKSGTEVRDDLERRALQSGQRIIRTVSVGSQKAIRTLSPFITDQSCLACHTTLKQGDVIAVLSETLVYQASLDATMKHLIGSGLAQTIILLIVIGFISIFIDKSVIQPVIRVGDAVKKFGQGDWTAVVDLKPGDSGKTFSATGKASPVKSLDEIGELAVAFNEMVRGLKEVTVSRDELAKEIDEHKKADERLRSITDLAQDAILMMDPQGNISYWNPSAERILGYRSEEVLGMNLHRLLAPARFHQAQAAALPEFFKTGRGTFIGKTIEVAALRKDGVEIPVDLSLSAFHREDGWHSMGILRDIAERKRAEENLARLSQKNELILNSAAEGILGLDLDGRHTFVNPVAAKMLGYEVHELIESPSHSLWHHTKSDGTPYPREDCQIYAAYRDGTVHSCSTEVFWRKNGTSFPVEYTSTPIYEGGKLLGAVVVFSDITDRKRAEDELRRQALELEMQSWGLQKANEGIKALYQELEKKNVDLAKLNQLKDDFVSIVAHELRSPLAVVREAVAIILDGLVGPVEPQQKTYLEMVRRTSEQLLRITNDLLDLAKIESGKIVLNLETIDFLSLARQSCEGISLRAQRKGIAVSEDFPEGKLEISGDFDKLAQVMTNLLSNALKFTEKGGITVEVKDLGEEVRCAVKDTGPGISKENLSRLFNKFEQFGKPSASSEKGSGLGLVISKSIIEAHGGRIWAESELGKGSSLIFSLPKHYKKKQKLGEILMEEKALTPAQLAEALRRQNEQKS